MPWQSASRREQLQRARMQRNPRPFRLAERGGGDGEAALWDMAVGRQEALHILQPDPRADAGDQIVPACPCRGP